MKQNSVQRAAAPRVASPQVQAAEDLAKFCARFSITPEAFSAFATKVMKQGIESGNVLFEDLGVEVVSKAKLEGDVPTVDVNSPEFLEVLALAEGADSEPKFVIANPIAMHVSGWGYLIHATKSKSATRLQALEAAVWAGTCALKEYEFNQQDLIEFIWEDIRAGIAARKVAGK